MTNSHLVRLGAILLALALIATPGIAQAKQVDSWWFDQLHLADAHKQTAGKGVTVAVIDQALDPSVPDLKGANIQFGQGCDSDKKTQPAGPGELFGHGTGMTTIIAGQGTGNAADGAGVTGVAPDATIRFYSDDTEPSTKKFDCSEFGLAKQFTRAVDDGADIISYSVGGTPEVEDAVQRAIAQGVVVVAASGEGGTFVSPAYVPGVVAVLAVDDKADPWRKNPRLSSSSPDAYEGGYPVISAPGVAVPVGASREGRWVSGFARTGTSDATALVAGLLALVKSKYPDATGNQLIQQLIHYPGGDSGYAWDSNYGFGIGSATNMLPHDPTKWPDVNPLLKGPYKAVEDFPMAIRGKKYPTATPQASDESKTETTATDTNSDDSVPVWAWGLVALLLLATAVGLAVVLTRRRRREDDNETGLKGR